jgi:hypothetical protein
MGIVFILSIYVWFYIYIYIYWFYAEVICEWRGVPTPASPPYSILS